MMFKIENLKWSFYLLTRSKAMAGCKIDRERLRLWLSVREREKVCVCEWERVMYALPVRRCGQTNCAQRRSSLITGESETTRRWHSSTMAGKELTQPLSQTCKQDGMAWATTRPKRNRGNISHSDCSHTKTQARLVMVEQISTDHQSLARERWQRKQRIRRRPKLDDGNSKSPTKEFGASVERFSILYSFCSLINRYLWTTFEVWTGSINRKTRKRKLFK